MTAQSPRRALTPGADRRAPALFLLGLLVSLLGVTPAIAGATILPAVTIEAPGPDIVGLGGVAMAEDGTGGLVFLKRVDGVTHVFVSRYVQNQWQAPIRVDGEEPFAASWPRIGAANGGQLLVVWATPFGSENGQPSEELLSATVGPGASSFGPAAVVDHDIGDGEGTSPDLAMSSTGQADVVYRVVKPQGEAGGVPLLRQGDVLEEVRVSHYLGEQWSEPDSVNRDLGISMRPPTATNAPQVALGGSGSGIVVWQEPEIDGIARIWARRLFGASVDYAMPVSASTYDGAPVEGDADAPSVALNNGGEAIVAYRQAGTAGTPLPEPRIFTDTLPNGESESGTEFRGALAVPSPAGSATPAAVGPPSASMSATGRVRVLFDEGGTPEVVTGNESALAPAFALGTPFLAAESGAASEVAPASTSGRQGAGISAWPSTDAQGNPGVGIREDFSDGNVQTALLSAPGGGPVGALAAGASSYGDGLVAFQQGPLGDAAILAVRITATPAGASVEVPQHWIRPAAARVSWEPLESANEPLTYTVVLDGHRVPTGAGVLSLRLDPRLLGDGPHTVRVLATDAFEQSSLSAPVELKIDTIPPAVRFAPADGGRGVSVRISDGQSGVAPASVSVGFGDGSHAGGRARLAHRYRGPGVYTVTVRARDRVGNATVVRHRVRIG